jgi:hypothetical protein
VSLTRTQRAVRMPLWDDDGRRVPWRVLSGCHCGMATGDECLFEIHSMHGHWRVGLDVVELSRRGRISKAGSRSF